MITSNHLINPQELRTSREILEVFWRKGVSGRALLVDHTKLIDAHLVNSLEQFPDYQDKVALVALGGYGRSELFPFSDIDLMLLHKPSVKKNLNQLTEAIFYPLWDAGLEVGHSVRTIKACLTDAKKEFFFQVAMLDARFLAGSISLYEKLQNVYQKKLIAGRRKQFLQEMVMHREERLRRYGNHSYYLEPQIKESRGGLRDIQSLLWTAKVVFGLKNLTDIADAGMLTTEESNGFEQAWDHLIKIRNRLHYISSRKNDRLYFEHQEEIAKAFKYRNSNNLLAVEQFMQDVYGDLRTIASTTELFFDHVDEVVNQSPSLLRKNRSDEKTLEPGVTVRRGKVYVLNHEQFSTKGPESLMRIFLHALRTGNTIHHRTLKFVIANLHRIDDKFRASASNTQHFFEILQHPNSKIILETMLECGFLAAYLPEFNRLKSLAQHDVYHVFTVDHHLIQTVDVLTGLQEEQKNIIQGLANLHILYLAALLHDIGKGSGQKHEEAGAEMVVNIGRRLGLNDQECSLLSFLVRYHLYLIDTALCRDLEDDMLIKRCTETIQNTDQLAMLYLLSIADAKATGPSVWSEWKAALLLDLYLKIALYLEKGESDQHDISQGIEWIRSKISATLDPSCKIDIDTLPEDYLLSFSPEEISTHLQNRELLNTDDLQLFPRNHSSYWSILILTKDRAGLLTKICGVIAVHTLKILSAQIFTWPDGTVVDVLYVTPTLNKKYSDQNWKSLKKDLKMALNYRLGLSHRLAKTLKVPANKRGSTASGRPATKVRFDNTVSDKYTVIEVSAKERVGILHEITKTLSDFGINIFRAKIGTRQETVVDVFYVLDVNRKKIKDKAYQQEIKQALVHAAR